MRIKPIGVRNGVIALLLASAFGLTQCPQTNPNPSQLPRIKVAEHKTSLLVLVLVSSLVSVPPDALLF